MFYEANYAPLGPEQTAEIRGIPRICRVVVPQVVPSPFLNDQTNELTELFQALGESQRADILAMVKGMVDAVE